VENDQWLYRSVSWIGSLTHYVGIWGYHCDIMIRRKKERRERFHDFSLIDGRVGLGGLSGNGSGSMGVIGVTGLMCVLYVLMVYNDPIVPSIGLMSSSSVCPDP
jgi:hypothetical protein